MNRKIVRILCGVIGCGLSSLALAQTCGDITYKALYQKGYMLFGQKAYSASIAPLQAFVREVEAAGDALPDRADKLEAEYMLACAEYELGHPDRIRLLQSFVDKHPDTPHACRIYALMASAYFAEGRYDEALQLFESIRLEVLADAERDDMTYRMAVCCLRTEQVKKAAVWFETLRGTSRRYVSDCSYYLAYIRYTQRRYDEALSGFLPLQDDRKYGNLVPYYIAECYVQKQQYAQAGEMARTYLKSSPDQTYAAEMYRIQGVADYQSGRYREAVTAFEQYMKNKTETQSRRDALYMWGLSYYHTGVYSQVPVVLGEVAAVNDALGQNAYMHMGLAYLQTGDKNKARLAFEQAAASNADLQVKERAAYNHALCIHETSYSAFGESVTVFERFLNEFPQSVYAERVSSYLVDVYMDTRSYEAALKSIERIGHPGTTILEAKQKILFQLGVQAFTNTRFPQATDYFDRSIALGKYNRQTHADALYWRGESYYRMNRMEAAAGDFNAYLRTTLQQDTEMYALAYYNLAYIAFHAKNYSSAREGLLQFTARERERQAALLADAYNRIGDCYLQVRAFDEAKQYYARAEAMHTPSGDYSYYQLALVAGLQKDYTGKAALLDRLVENYPQSSYVVHALYEKGRTYVQAGEGTQAVAVFSRLLDTYPDSPFSRKAAAEIGLLYYQSGQNEKAVNAYKYVITHYPGSEEARLAMHDLKSLYVDANRVDEYAALVAQMPGNIRFETSEQDSLTFMAAEKVYMRGEKEQARSSFLNYLHVYPDGAFALNAHYYLCVMAKQQSDEAALLEHAGRLLEYPDSPYTEEILLMRGEVRFNHRQYVEAKSDYRQLQLKAATADRKRLGMIGVLRCAAQLKEDVEIVEAASLLLNEAKLAPELKSEALYFRAKACLRMADFQQAERDLKILSEDTRTLYGAEAKYLLAQRLYDSRNYAASEKELLDFIEKSTPHAYWLARGFVLLADVYMAIGKPVDARQYLLSLRQNYQGDDDIESMISERLARLDAAR